MNYHHCTGCMLQRTIHHSYRLGKMFSLTEKDTGKVQCTWFPASSMLCLATRGTQGGVSIPLSVACLGQIRNAPASEQLLIITPPPYSLKCLSGRQIIWCLCH